jgi:hypothetical protein
MVALIRVEEVALGVEKVAHYVSGPLRGWGTYPEAPFGLLKGSWA